MNGLKVTTGNGMTRLELECEHQHRTIYITEGAERNWVCSRLLRPAHSLAGFIGELEDLKDARIREVMQRWGIYSRTMPLAVKDDDTEEGAEDG